MSKTSLKKELAGFTKEQLIELILEMYDAKKEIKDYLKFYLNPDSEALYEKFSKTILKELTRNSRYHLKARFSNINKMLKDFESYSPDYDAREKMYQFIILHFIALTDHYGITETQLNGCYKIAYQYLKFADKNQHLDDAVNTLAAFARQEKYGQEYYRNYIFTAVDEYFEDNKL